MWSSQHLKWDPSEWRQWWRDDVLYPNSISQGITKILQAATRTWATEQFKFLLPARPTHTTRTDTRPSSAPSQQPCIHSAKLKVNEMTCCSFNNMTPNKEYTLMTYVHLMRSPILLGLPDAQPRLYVHFIINSVQCFLLNTTMPILLFLLPIPILANYSRYRIYAKTLQIGQCHVFHKCILAALQKMIIACYLCLSMSVGYVHFALQITFETVLRCFSTNHCKYQYSSG